MTDEKMGKGCSIPRQEMDAVLADFAELVQIKIDEINSRIQSEKYTASESYISDMKGYARGMSATANMAIKFFREKLMY